MNKEEFQKLADIIHKTVNRPFVLVVAADSSNAVCIGEDQAHVMTMTPNLDYATQLLDNAADHLNDMAELEKQSNTKGFSSN